MTPFECYRSYIALKRHFSSSYDYFLYNGKVNASYDAFEARKDKVFFAKTAKHPDALNFMMVQMLHDPKVWIRNIAYNKDAEDRYQEWAKKKQSLMYIFKEEIDKLEKPFKSNFPAKNNEHPKAIVAYQSGEISLETLVVLTMVTNCFKYWDKKLVGDPVWEELSVKIKKYAPFLGIDTKKAKKIIVAALNEGV